MEPGAARPRGVVSGGGCCGGGGGGLAGGELRRLVEVARLVLREVEEHAEVAEREQVQQHLIWLREGCGWEVEQHLF